MLRWVVAYDVPDDRRRARLALVLEDFGDRMQYSVFEVLAEGEDLATLRERIAGVIDPREDKVRFYALCDACVEKAFDLGKVEGKAFDQPDVIIV